MQRLQLGGSILIRAMALKTANFHEYQSAKPAPDLLEQASSLE
jgi:hypothetical protein